MLILAGSFRYDNNKLSLASGHCPNYNALTSSTFLWVTACFLWRKYSWSKQSRTINVNIFSFPRDLNIDSLRCKRLVFPLDSIPIVLTYWIIKRHTNKFWVWIRITWNITHHVAFYYANNNKPTKKLLFLENRFCSDASFWMVKTHHFLRMRCLEGEMMFFGHPKLYSRTQSVFKKLVERLKKLSQLLCGPNICTIGSCLSHHTPLL
jgi:hypothetical protein